MEPTYDVEHPLAKDIMTPNVYQIDSEEPLARALDLMYEKRVSGILVHESEKNQYFIVTQKDIIAFLYHNYEAPIEIRNYKVKVVMEGPITFIDPEMPVDYLIRFLLTRGFRRVIIGKDGIPLGVVSLSDILQWNSLYFKPAKPLIFMILDNLSGIIIAKHVFEENLEQELDSDLVELIGGAFSSISNIIEEVISNSGHIRELEKDNFKIIFEPREFITGILFVNNKSLDLRHRLHSATNAFCDTFVSDIERIKQGKGAVEIRDITKIAIDHFHTRKRK